MKVLFVIVLLSVSAAASAHHSFAMFDRTKHASVTGTVAKIEWSNPHISVWAYVPKKNGQEGYDLYAFESGGANLMARYGWSKDVLAVGEKVTIEYWPLKDGRNGGAFVKATHPDGHVTMGDPVAAALKE